MLRNLALAATLTALLAAPALAQGRRGPCAGAPAPAGSLQRPCGGAGPDVSKAVTLEGVVKSFTGGPGAGRPTLVLSTAQGDREIVASPYRALSAAGFAPAAGMKLKVVAAPVTLDGAEHWVALSLSDLEKGTTVTLRDPSTGIPAGGRGRCRRS